MNTLIIYTHPNHNSLNYGFLKSTMAGIQKNKNIDHVKVIDLYEEKFDPALIFNEEKRRRDMHLDPELVKYQDLIKWSDKIVMIYPIWWGRPPAMLLGFIDKLFTSNFAYKDVGKMVPEGLLKGKSVICISTMDGFDHYPLLLLNNAHKILMKRALFNFVGIKKVKFFEFGNVSSPKGNVEKKLKKVEAYFTSLAS